MMLQIFLQIACKCVIITIEGVSFTTESSFFTVAPRTGAWIEIGVSLLV